MTSQPITRLEWWIGIALVLAALTILGLYVMRVAARMEAVSKPRVVPVASATTILHRASNRRRTASARRRA